MGTDRKQDTWFMKTEIKNGSDKEIFSRRGIIDLPRAVDAVEAADYAVRCEVRDTLRHHNPAVTDGTTVVCSIFGKFETTPGYRSVHASAVARYDEDMDVFQRLMPWVQEDHWEEVKSQEGARIEPLDWR